LRYLLALDSDTVFANLGRPGVRVWIVLSDPNRVRVFFSVQDAVTVAPRYLMIEVPLDEGLDEIGIEQLGQVVYPSAHALWMGEVETPRVDLERELHATAPSPLPARRSTVSTMRISIGPEYEAVAQGEGINQSIGGTVAVFGQRLGLRAHVAAMLPREASNGGMTVAFHGAGVAAGGALAHPLGRRTHLLGELGAGLDIIAYRPTMLPAPALPMPGGTDVQPIVYARIGGSVALGSSSLAIEAVANLHLRRTHYDVELDGESRELVVPWLFQPGIAATVTW
jgi:hypothetical protein